MIFTATTKIIQYLGINLMKDMLSEENCKTLLLKNLEEDLNKWVRISCLQTGSFNLVKISITPNLIYEFNAIPMKIPTSFFLKLHKVI